MHDVHLTFDSIEQIFMYNVSKIGNDQVFHNIDNLLHHEINNILHIRYITIMTYFILIENVYMKCCPFYQITISEDRLTFIIPFS